MIQFANAKINLGLYIVKKRSDGYHNLETVFCPIPLFDVVEIIESGEMRFELSGVDIPGGETENLCLQAYTLLRKDFDLPPVTIYLHKTIPVGAGLGGGSSDTVATLQGLNSLFRIGLSSDSLEDYARQIGSDCAFFVRNQPAFARGRGDRLEQIRLDFQGYRQLLLIKPDIRISTAEAYRRVTPKQPTHDLKAAIGKPLAEWHKLIANDFEEGLFLQYPLLKEIKNLLYRQGAVYASMSGSGSAIYGIFGERISREALESIRKLVGTGGFFELELPG